MILGFRGQANERSNMMFDDAYQDNISKYGHDARQNVSFVHRRKAFVFAKGDVFASAPAQGGWSPAVLSRTCTVKEGNHLTLREGKISNRDANTRQVQHDLRTTEYYFSKIE